MNECRALDVLGRQKKPLDVGRELLSRGIWIVPSSKLEKKTTTENKRKKKQMRD